MNNAVLKLRNMNKRYGNMLAVDDVSMTIQKGDIYGLIGRNGAGKTTLFRIITSLAFADTGEMELFGEGTPSGLQMARKRMGCVVETPALYPNLSAVQNLEYYRILRGIPDRGVIEKSLRMVGLTDTGKKKCKNFSLGMKQRLGIALALLNSPDFLLLDEPVNGLDPMGIVEMRETLKTLNREHGITMIVSSHILSELSLIATRYGIINDGRLLKELSNDELREECQRCLAVDVDDAARAASVLETELHTTKYKITGTREIRLYDYLDNPSEVTLKLSAGGVRVSSLREVGDNLEDYFVALIREGK